MQQQNTRCQRPRRPEFRHHAGAHRDARQHRIARRRGKSLSRLQAYGIPTDPRLDREPFVEIVRRRTLIKVWQCDRMAAGAKAFRKMTLDRAKAKNRVKQDHVRHAPAHSHVDPVILPAGACSLKAHRIGFHFPGTALPLGRPSRRNGDSI
ncbi:hypothetical protein [Mesorhizobium sp. B2-5-13]|uniref:hypothetical protein n=1 Tax=unclassified Mesorhizobium TaxID=325217 RepID=UPI0032B21671